LEIKVPVDVPAAAGTAYGEKPDREPAPPRAIFVPSTPVNRGV